jgi:type VI secretion system protein
MRIVSDHAAYLGPGGTKLFGVHGGSIGRAGDNDWILPDPERYLSGKHARVDFRAGTFYLVDTSSNGTFINGSKVALGKFHDYALKEGDYIRLGAFEVLVSIDASNDFPPDEGAIVAYDGHAPSAAVRKSTANDIGADLDLSELLEPSGSLEADRVLDARGVYTQSPLLDPVGSGDGAPALDRAASGYASEPAPAPSPESAPWHMLTRPIRVESFPSSPRPAAAAAPVAPEPPVLSAAVAAPPGVVLYDGDTDPGLAAFCRGAGIDPRSITPEARAGALQLAGRLLRESVVGMMEMHQARYEFRNRFRIPSPAPEDSPPSLNFALGVDETLLRLLTNRSVRTGPVEALRDHFRDLKAQHAATLVAMQAAFEQFLARLSPHELEERFEQNAKRGATGAKNKARYWDLYAELFQGIAQRPPDGFPHLFIEAFGRAYEAKVRDLAPPRAFGSVL